MKKWDAGLLLLVCALSFAQSQSMPVIRIDVNLVQVDAIVTDSKNRHVSDLTADDFIVLQDGKPQTISNCSYITTGASVAPAIVPVARSTSVSPAPPAPPPALKPTEVRRMFALVVDDLGLSFTSMAFVRDALRKFVDQQMQPGDMAAIIRTSAGLGVLQQFTTDKTLLHAAIDRVKFTEGRVGVDSFGPVNPIDDPNAVYPASGPTVSLSPADLDPSTDQSRAQMFTVGTLGAVQYVIDGLRDMPGRKSLVLFSENLVLHDLEPGLLPAPMSGGGGPTVFVEQITQGMHRLVDAANRASVVIYTIDPRGVQVFLPSASDRVGGGGSKHSPDPIGAVLAARQDQMFKSQEGLWTLAEETGGLFIHNDNFIEDAIKQAVADTEGYYLIGYHPDAETFDAKTGARKFHRLEVKLKKAGLHVRSRSGFFGESDAEARNIPRNGHEQLIHAVTSPFASGDVHVRLTALFQQSSDGRPFIDAMLHIDAADLKFAPQPDGGQKASLEVEAMTFGESGTPVDQSDRFFDIALNAAQYAGVQKYGLVYRVNQPLQHPGMYQVRVGLRDQDSGRLGSASQFMVTPDLSKGRLALSSIVLAEDASHPAEWGGAHAEGRLANSDPTSSAADRVFQPGTALSYQYAIFNAQPDAQGHTDLQGTNAHFPGRQAGLRGLADGAPGYRAGRREALDRGRQHGVGQGDSAGRLRAANSGDGPAGEGQVSHRVAVDGLRNRGSCFAHDTITGMSIDERLEALTVNLELASRDIQDLRGAIRDITGAIQKLNIASQQDGENIRALARIAEMHERRLTHLEGDDS